MVNLQIRQVQKEDYADICALINSELGYPDVKLDELALRMEIMSQDKNYTTFVALLDNKIVGFIGTVRCIAFEVSSECMRIIALAVSNKNRNKGIGSSLLKHAEDFAFLKGITVFALNSGMQRLDAHMFYERNGYNKKSYGFVKEIEGL